MSICLLLVEACLRVLLDPIDVLKPDLVADPILGHAIAAGSGGHDDWGFRNSAVPEHAEIVALGDSMTYGFAATMSDSWPSWLARLSGKSVYNLGVGGYGPAEYSYLLEARALELEPELVLVGLYFGNDIHNANRAVETRPYWSSYRANASAKADVPSGSPAAASGRSKSPRDWLRSHSMIFRIVEESSLGQRINAIGDLQALPDTDGCHVALTEPFSTVLKLDLRIVGVDMDNPEVQRGLALTLQFLDRMIDSARAAGTEVAVVLVPSKERVLAPLAAPVEAPCDALLAHFVASETEAHDAVVSLLKARGVRFVDPLNALTAAAARDRIYLRSGDTHPNGFGYRVIAEAVRAALLDGPETVPEGAR
jgi:lysophospholipase L1-like esterase